MGKVDPYLQIPTKGTAINFYVHRHPDGSCPVLDFFDELSPSEQAKVAATFEFIIACGGLVRNEQKFKRLEGQKGGDKDPFYEIKVFQIRIGCIFEGRSRLIMLHAFKKQQDLWPKGEIVKLHNRYGIFEQQRRQR